MPSDHTTIPFLICRVSNLLAVQIIPSFTRLPQLSGCSASSKDIPGYR